jgi:hypothetical protein
MKIGISFVMELLVDVGFWIVAGSQHGSRLQSKRQSNNEATKD